MAKASKKVNGIVLDDASVNVTPASNGPIVDPVLTQACEYGMMQGKGFSGTLDLLKSHAAQSFEDIRKGFMAGHIAGSCNGSIDHGNFVLGLTDRKPFLPENENPAGMRTAKQQRDYASAKTAWSRLIDRARQLKYAGIPEKMKQERTAPPAGQTKVTTTEGERKLVAPLVATPEVVRSLSVHKAKTQADAFALLRAERDRMMREINENAALLTGDEGSAWRFWISSAPKFDKA